MKTVKDYSFENKTALVRVDLNVPLNKDFQVTDDTRIKATIPTIKKILEDGGKAVLMSHLGRPKNVPENKFSLQHIVGDLEKAYGAKVQFSEETIGEKAETAAQNLKNGEVLLLENVRFHEGETKGDEAFAEALSKLGDVYVNDAFGTAHRAHASTTVVAKFFTDKMAGFVMAAEIENADKVLEKADKPYTAIMGGAKISDKILIIEKLLGKVDNLIIGGGMSYTFFKAMGGKIGNSLVEEDKLDLAKELIQKAKEQGVELKLPIDSIVADNFANDANTKIAQNHAIEDGWMGLDIGPKTAELFVSKIKSAKTIVWNGPMGVFEMEAFASGTKAVANALAEATQNGARTVVGGGDSASAIKIMGLEDKVSHVSTGGGASLEMMEGKHFKVISIL
ncbi:MAG: phosphoglycerate kinase, partial [Bacteroidetes bacterium]